LICIMPGVLARGNHRTKETDMSKHLTAAQRTLLANALSERQLALERQLELHQQGLTRAEHAREELEEDVHEAPQRASDREVDLAISELDLDELDAVRKARLRVDDASYGQCVGCGRPIPFERLLIEPHTLRCVACETVREARH
jgi:DnaK suppressor protein